MPSEPTSRWARSLKPGFAAGSGRRCCSRRRGAAPWGSGVDLVASRRPCRARLPTSSAVAGAASPSRPVGSSPKWSARPSASTASMARTLSHHVAVADRARAAAVVARHAADAWPGWSRDVDREHRPCGPRKRIELVQHQARLHGDGPCLRVEVEHPVADAWLTSMTSASPIVCPHCEVPPPRGSTGDARHRRRSGWRGDVVLALRGTTTPIGSIW